eukprot:XP_011681931.1 PREDICTED: GPI inositol-deacylase-like [Strongylocentrotus purpuratus]
MNETLQEKYPHYSLTVYGEGRYATNLEKGKYTGIPILFIPGNAGSHKQVRSLSSIALRKASDKYNFHFNYFSVDLDEELNAVYGGVLEGQTEPQDSDESQHDSHTLFSTSHSRSRSVCGRLTPLF